MYYVQLLLEFFEQLLDFLGLYCDLLKSLPQGLESDDDMVRYSSYRDKQLDVFLLGSFFVCALDFIPGIPIDKYERHYWLAESALTI